MTRYSLRKSSPARSRADLVVVGVCRREPAETGRKRGAPAPVVAPVVAPGGEAVAAAYGSGFGPLLASLRLTGAEGECVVIPTGGTVKSGLLMLVGLGPERSLDRLAVRRGAAVAARSAGNVSSVALALPARDAGEVTEVVRGFRSGSYRFERPRPDGAEGRGRTKPDREEEPRPGFTDVVVLSDLARTEAAGTALTEALVLADAVDLVRDLTNTPPNLLGPAELADAAVSALQHTSVSVEVLEEQELRELGCGGILAVGSGSTRPPKLVRMTYVPRRPRARVALVGKGITFDSGGLTIKGGSSMAHMKLDMAGAASVVAAIRAVAALELPVAVTAYAPLAENMVSGTAMRPGDVFTSYSGKTVEITNADAEGRLVLGDALAKAAEDEPDAICEISTLTGACETALGSRIAGLFGTDDEVERTRSAAASAGERVWPLPVTERTREAVRTESRVADLLQHRWVRWGSASWAAAFLMEFVADRPFCHIDVAGPAWNDGGPWGEVPKGATGFGVPTLVEWVRARGAEVG